MFSTSDVDRGREALKEFHNYSMGYSAYNLSYDELLRIIGGKNPEIFLDGLGFAIREIGMSSSQVSQAMKAITLKSQGAIPKSQAVFFSALSNRASNLSTSDWFFATPEILLESGKDVAMGFKEVGDAVLDTGKSFLVIGPLLIVVGVIYFGFLYSKKRLGV